MPTSYTATHRYSDQRLSPLCINSLTEEIYNSLKSESKLSDELYLTDESDQAVSLSVDTGMYTPYKDHLPSSLLVYLLYQRVARIERILSASGTTIPTKPITRAVPIDANNSTYVDPDSKSADPFDPSDVKDLIDHTLIKTEES